MKNSKLKFIFVFICGMSVSILLSVFASNITISTDFNTATQFLKKIVVLNSNDEEKVILEGDSNNVATINGNTQIDGSIYAGLFCKYGTNTCIDISRDIINKISSMEMELKTKALQLTQHFDYNHVYGGMNCTVDREGQIIYAYNDSNADDGYLYLCKRVPNAASPHYEWRKISLE